MTIFAVAVLVFFVLMPTPSGAMPRRSGATRSAKRRHRFHASHVSLLTRISAWVRDRRHGANSKDDIPQMLELLGRCLRAGASLRTAVNTVAHDFPRSMLSDVVAQANSGVSLTEAIDRWASGNTDCQNTDRQMAAALLVLGHISGAAMASSLDRAAASIRQRQSLSDEIRALTAQTRMSSLVVAVAPVGFAGVIALVDSESLVVLLTTPVGILSLVLGSILECLGIWWMSRLSRSVLSWA